MTEPAIVAENLSKRYRIGQRYSYGTLRDSLVGAVSRAGGRLRPRPPRTSPDPDDGSPYIWALKDVSFTVEPGEVLGIVGHNGAGKTTLLKVLSRVTDPTSGRGEIHGRIGSLLEVGTGFHQELTGRENVYLSGAILGMKRAEIDRKFDEIVAFAEYEKFIDTPVKRYSSGMQVRLGFSVAAHLDTEILLVDEVLAVGDTAFQKKSLSKMREITRQGRTVLVVSHNMASIQGICTRAILLSRGRITCEGDPHYVVEEYLKSVVERSPANGALASSPDGRVVLRAVDFVDDAGRVLDGVVSGQTFSIRVEVQCADPVGTVAVDLGIDDSAGRRVAVLSNLMAGEDLQLGPPSTAIVCRVPQVPLAPGEYTIEVHLMGPNDLDLLRPAAANLRVESGDFFGSGKMVEAWWVGSTLIRHHWAAERLPDPERRA
ncbi:MAG TPA: ABC transporter ATP-binding protein [Thermoplasmata archaeon]|nr:ABC transporter ATP-binding protein [Thermoplasmata archaeon]